MLSKMQRAVVVKIKLVRKLSVPIIVAVSLLGILIVMSIVSLVKEANKDCNLYLGEECFLVERVDTDENRQQGLSGRKSIARNQAMLFSFEDNDKHCFWMKDMHFSIDMMWLDEQKKIVHIEETVSPDTYPKTFCPSESARYVIEVKAGTSSRLDLEVGQALSF